MSKKTEKTYKDEITGKINNSKILVLCGIIVSVLLVVFKLIKSYNDVILIPEEERGMIVYGVILDTNTNKPISGAEIFFQEYNREYHVMDDGQFYLPIEGKKKSYKQMKVTANGYKPITPTILVDFDESKDSLALGSIYMISNSPSKIVYIPKAETKEVNPPTTKPKSINDNKSYKELVNDLNKLIGVIGIEEKITYSDELVQKYSNHKDLNIQQTNPSATLLLEKQTVKEYILKLSTTTHINGIKISSVDSFEGDEILKIIEEYK
jgi:hypothetical protein